MIRALFATRTGVFLRAVLAFGLALHVMAQILIPCSDQHVQADPGTDVVVQAGPDTETHSHMAETCSPFCVCQCCGAAVQAIRYAFQTDPVLQPFFPARNFRIFHFESLICLPFWQPPKIGFPA